MFIHKQLRQHHENIWKIIWIDAWYDLTSYSLMAFCCAVALGLHVTNPVGLKGQRVGGHSCLTCGLSVRVRISWFSHDLHVMLAMSDPSWLHRFQRHCFTRNIKNISKPVWTSTSWHRDCTRKTAKMSVRTFNHRTTSESRGTLRWNFRWPQRLIATKSQTPFFLAINSRGPSNSCPIWEKVGLIAWVWVGMQVPL